MPRPPIDGSVTLVTGASAGLGVEFARQLAPRVRVLALAARRVDRLETLAAELRARHPELTVMVQQADLGDQAQCEAVVRAIEEAHGAIDILINNAGLGDLGMFDLSSWDKVEKMLRVNVVALSFLMWRVLPGMIARRRGGILNVSSGNGLEWLPGFAVYAGTKHYVTALTESVYVEARPHGVLVSQVCPGPVMTEFQDVMGNFTGQSLPTWIQLTAEACVRKTLAGFRRGKPLIVPGLLMKFLRLLGATSLRSTKRLVYAPIASRLRTLQLRARAGEEQRQIGGG